MTRKRISCFDIEENSRFLIPQYYQETKSDSIRYLLRYWQRNCGETEVITRMNLILDAEVNVLDKYPFSKGTVWNLLQFKRKSEFARKNPERKDYYTGNIFWRNQEKINDPFDLFTSVAASDAMKRSESLLAKNLLGFYSGSTDSLFPSLNRNNAGNAMFQSSYDSIITDIRSEFITYMGVTAGYWMPTGNASALGDHPEVGFVMGGMRHGYSLDLMIAVRFLDAPSPYLVPKKGIPTSTADFLGTYFAGQYGLDVLSEKNYDVSLLTGIGYDGFNAIPSSGANANDNVNVHSWNVNLGVGGRYYTEEFRDGFISWECRYNIVNYTNTGGTDLSGDAWVFRVGYYFAESWQYVLLRDLGAY
jgi:hypothetical protein